MIGNLSTIIASSDEVIEASTDFDPGFPGHDARDAIAQRWRMSRNSSLTPPDAFITVSSDLQLCAFPTSTASTDVYHRLF